MFSAECCCRSYYIVKGTCSYICMHGVCRSVVKAREAAEAIDRDVKTIAARAREAEARRADLERQYKLQVHPGCITASISKK